MEASVTPPLEEETPPTGEPEEEPDRLELIAAIILGLAATLIAFTTYQGGLAGGASLEGYTESTQNLTDANFFYNRAFNEEVYDEGLFLEYAILINSEDEGDQVAAEYLLDVLMTQNLADAIEWWEETEDATTPFDEGSPYAHEDDEAADEFQTAADDGLDRAFRHSTIGSQFGLAGVILAIALFFSGISTVLASRRISVALLSVASIALVIGALVIVQAFSAKQALIT